MKRSSVVDSGASGFVSFLQGIIVSKEMSGTFNVVQKAAEKIIQEGKKITVINSKLNFGAQGLLVLDAAKLLEDEKNYEEVVETIKDTVLG